MITVIAELRAQSGKEELLAELIIKITKEVRQKEKGAVMYSPHVSAKDPGVIVILEKYSDREAFEYHTQTQYFKDFMKESAKLVDGEPRVQFMKELV